MALSGLTGKVAVVAGGATGIGAATAARLAGEGCLVVIGDVAADVARRTAEDIGADGGNSVSVGFDLADPDSVAYATAKAGIGALTRHVASRWGKDGIRCNAVAPGFTATEAIRAAPQWPELETAALRRIRGPCVGAPDDIAALVAFLISQEGEWVNGQVINIDGGTVLR